MRIRCNELEEEGLLCPVPDCLHSSRLILVVVMVARAIEPITSEAKERHLRGGTANGAGQGGR